MEDLIIEVDANARLLDQIDPIFGWAGCFYFFEKFWMYLPQEVWEKIDEACSIAEDKAKNWQAAHPERFK